MFANIIVWIDRMIPKVHNKFIEEAISLIESYQKMGVTVYDDRLKHLLTQPHLKDQGDKEEGLNKIPMMYTDYRMKKEVRVKEGQPTEPGEFVDVYDYYSGDTLTGTIVDKFTKLSLNGFGQRMRITYITVCDHPDSVVESK